MIQINNVILPSPEQMIGIIHGMRNPLNSWDRQDSFISTSTTTVSDDSIYIPEMNLVIGPNDYKLMTSLAKAGSEHRKYLRMMPVIFDITAGHTFWLQFDTYKIATVKNSCSKMHKIHVSSFAPDDFDHEGIDEVDSVVKETFENVRGTLQWLADMYNKTKEKKYWRALIELLPMGYHITATVYLNYEVLGNMYHQRDFHKVYEWREYCEWIKSLPLSELITGKFQKGD